jgi:hypothetical protein
VTEVTKGQVWEDTDPRMAPRYLLVERVEDGKAVCNLCTMDGRVISARVCRIRVDRMRPRRSSSGYRLHREAR